MKLIFPFCFLLKISLIVCFLFLNFYGDWLLIRIFKDNAFYDITANAFTVTLRFLTPPVYKLEFPQWFNYASQGITVGHELSHGFDGVGVQFGSRGELAECSWDKCGWMDANSSHGFHEMAQCVVRQYSTGCCPLKEGPVRCVNGEMTNGESLADIAGSQAAYFAFQNYSKTHKVTGVKSLEERYSINQLFWISTTPFWCQVEKTDKDEIFKALLTNPHPPAKCRVNQVLQNIPEFGRDFNCTPGSPMFPLKKDQCKVWIGGK